MMMGHAGHNHLPFTLAKQGSRKGTRELLAGPASAPTAEIDKVMMKNLGA